MTKGERGRARRLDFFIVIYVLVFPKIVRFDIFLLDQTS